MIDWPEDTAERIAFMRGQRMSWCTIAMALGVSEMTVRAKAEELGLLHRIEPQPWPRRKRKFSPEDIAYLRAEWAKHTPYQEIAAHLGRSPGVIRQRVYHYEKDLPTRVGAAVQLVRKFGHAALQNGATVEEAVTKTQEAIGAAKAEAKRKAKEAQQAHIRRMLDIADLEISTGADRNEVIFKTRHAGLTLEIMGQHFGITRERIRQICDMVAFQRSLERQTEAVQ
jgi:DNA-binding Lrp family transcriptional regulator